MFFINTAKPDMTKKEKFDFLYKKYYRYVYKIVFNILKEDKHIDDTIQELFMKIWKCISRLDINDENSCKAFISVIAKNTAINKYNKDKKENSEFIDVEDGVLHATTGDSNSDPAEIIVNDANVEYIYQKIAELGEKYSDVLLLKYKYYLTPEEISKLTDINLKTVYTRLLRGRELLKEKLSEEGRKQNEQ